MMAKFSLILILAVVLPTSASLEMCSEQSTMMQVHFSKRDAMRKDYGISTSSLDGCLLKLNYTKYSTKLQHMSSDDKRNTVIVFLNQKGKGSISDLQGKNDEQLFSVCWQTVVPGKSVLDECLLKTGERNITELNDMSDDDKRNAEIVMFNKKGKGSIPDLQAAGNGQLYSMCYEEILVSLQCYLDRYPVVSNYYGKHNLTGAEEHFETKGELRGLDPQCRDMSKFDDRCVWQCYLDNNPRLAKNIGSTNTAAARRHYDQFGYREKRICHCTTTTTTTTWDVNVPYPKLNKCGSCYSELQRGYTSQKKPAWWIVHPQRCFCYEPEDYCKTACFDDPTCMGYSSNGYSPDKNENPKCEFLTSKDSPKCPWSCYLNGQNDHVWSQGKPLVQDSEENSKFCDASVTIGKGEYSKDWSGCRVKPGTPVEQSKFNWI